MSVYVLLPVTSDQQQRLRDTAPGETFTFTTPASLTLADIADARIIVGNPAPNSLAHARNLELLQLTSAGYDRYVGEGILPAKTALTCASGAYGQAVSEHMMAMLFAQMNNLFIYRDQQTKHDWHPAGRVRSLVGAQVLVLGTGDIGTHFAQLSKALGATVTGARRHVDPAQTPTALQASGSPFTEILSLADARTKLATFDVVASFLPGTPETSHLVDAQFLTDMKPGSYLVNGGRGTLIDQPALIDALTSAHLAGAALDVCDPEPLPATDPLWDAPNLALTPHQAGNFNLPATVERIVDIAVANISALLSGTPLHHQVR